MKAVSDIETLPVDVSKILTALSIRDRLCVTDPALKAPKISAPTNKDTCKKLQYHSFAKQTARVP